MDEIKLNQFQLNILLNQEEKEDYQYILNLGIYCVRCEEMCPKGVEVIDNILNSMNDILIKGRCKKCGKTVKRFIEFGEDREFYERAQAFRKSIGED